MLEDKFNFGVLMDLKNEVVDIEAMPPLSIPAEEHSLLIHGIMSDQCRRHPSLYGFSHLLQQIADKDICFISCELNYDQITERWDKMIEEMKSAMECEPADPMLIIDSYSMGHYEDYPPQEVDEIEERPPKNKPYYRQFEKKRKGKKGRGY